MQAWYCRKDQSEEKMFTRLFTVPECYYKYPGRWSQTSAVSSSEKSMTEHALEYCHLTHDLVSGISVESAQSLSTVILSNKSFIESA